MSAPHPFNQFTPFPEARGNWPPLPPRCPDGGGLPSLYRPTMSEIVPRWGMPSNFEIPPWNNLNTGLHEHELGCMYPSDPHRWSPSWRGNEFHEGPLSRRSIVDRGTGTSNEMKVCRQFQRRGKCAYGDQCRFLHEMPERTRDFGSSSQNFEVRTGHAMDRPRGFDQLEEVRSKVQTKIVACNEIPKPVSYKTRPCYPWQTTGRCPYGEVCRFAHGEAGTFSLLVYKSFPLSFPSPCSMFSSDLQFSEQE